MDDFEKELGDPDNWDLGDVEPSDGWGDLLDEPVPEPAETALSPVEEKVVLREGMQPALGGISTYVDIVFCIDVTFSMAPIINTVKNMTLELYDDLITNMREKNNRIVKQLRVKVIAFRDYYCDGPYAMTESDFFLLPDQKNEFRDFVASLEALGGGDEPENALEAMALAMKSDWVKVKDPNTEKARNVIVIFTDASAHPLEKAADGVPENYPSDMLKSYNELYEAWCGQGTCMDSGSSYTMDKMAERLVIFAPEDAYPWSDMAEEIDYAAVVPISAAEGGSDLGKETIIATISGSMK